jgi:transcriptional regulator GlxA family with amidase domain
MQLTTRPVVQCVFTIPPKVHVLDICGPMQIFYEALEYGAPVKLLFSNIHASENSIESSCSLYFSHLEDFNSFDLKKGDLVFIPGLESYLLSDNRFLCSSKPFQNWLTEQYNKGVTICSICTGAYLLAEAGLLNDKECTTHWRYIDRFANRYPLAKVQQNRLFVHSGNLFTSAGVAAGIDLSLFLVEQLFGAHFAAQIAKEVVVYLRRTAFDPQLTAFLQHRNHINNRIHSVQDILGQSLDKKLNIESLAEQVYMSGRNLTRLFKKTTGVTIGQYVDQLRLERARQMMREGHTIQAAAEVCGLKSSNQLRRLLKK